MTREITDDQRMALDLFAGDKDDGGVRMRSSKMVTVRTHQTCLFETPHPIKMGSRARCEKALIDGRWRSFYCCVDCLDKWIREYC